MDARETCTRALISLGLNVGTVRILMINAPTIAPILTTFLAETQHEMEPYQASDETRMEARVAYLRAKGLLCGERHDLETVRKLYRKVYKLERHGSDL